ncbi:hypothetical protein F5Y14DRAFT_40516 [Nemania sp. NC0429]|nr:hypothetical protein F5Y14DRAFT_40516 [Nemania sp. NC0429]
MDETNLDNDAGFDESLDVHMSDFPMGNATDAVPPESTSTVVPSVEPHHSRRYLSKRPHRKSRAGCKQCKKRKVKCDEAKPTCKACTLRKEQCVYPHASPAPPSGATSLPNPYTAVPLPVRVRDESGECCSWELDDGHLNRDLIPVISEPLFIPDQVADIVDMKMLWFYTTFSFQSFSINAGRMPEIDYALKVKIVEHAFRSSFLMETLKALSALQLRALNQPVPAHKVIAYQTNAFQGYRGAIEKADPKDFPALLGCSLFTIAMSSQTFRDPNGKRLFLIDWMAMWRGIGLIVELISPQAVIESGLAPILYRPPIYLEKSAQYIPNNLLFMVTSITYGDADYEYRKEYYDFIRCLGSLYMELTEHGFGPVLDLRVITLLSFCPRPLLLLAKQLRPRILIIMAYWLCFVKLMNPGVWWMRGLTPQADQIFEEISEEWEHLLRVPKMVMQTEDRVQNARLIIDNFNWTPSELDLYHKNRDPRAKTDIKLISNEGVEIEAAGSQWRPKDNGLTWGGPRVADMDAEPEASSSDLLIGSNLLYKVATYAQNSASPASSSEASFPEVSPPGLSSSDSPSKSPSP